jgi:hypothetical protein
MKPHTYPSGVHNNFTSNATKLVTQLPTVGCPTGTIPMLRRIVEGDPIKSSHFHTMNNELNWKVCFSWSYTPLSKVSILNIFH